MRDPFGPGTLLGYCTNVHPDAPQGGVRGVGGAGGVGEERRGVAAVEAALLEHACGVKDRVCPGSPLPVGLWLSARTALELLGDHARFESFREFLSTHGLAPFTYNAFPWGDFHGSVVKHRVYRPDWSEYDRLEHTVAIAAIAAELSPPGGEVSISTLPVSWGKAGSDGSEPPCDLHAAAGSLRALAAHLAKVREETGRLIHVDLEPEPGCYLDTAGDVVRFFEGFLLARAGAGRERMIREHVRVCHDVCHSAVMREDQAGAMEAYARAGVRVGKVQLSAAIGADLDRLPVERRGPALDRLRTFAEDRYLHQTTVLDGRGALRFFEDLPGALAGAEREPSLLAASWRTHFHVPLFVSEVGDLRTTADEIAPAIAAARALHDTRHFEVETYAWGVLPEGLRAGSLAEGIAREMLHVRAGRCTDGRS